MDTILSAKIIEALSNGKTTEFIQFSLIFIFLWVEVRGMKKEIKSLNETVSKSFADGERRFQSLEDTNKKFEHRLTLLENTQTQGG